MLKVETHNRSHTTPSPHITNTPTPPPYIEFGNALAEFENTLQKNKNIYDFQITREDAPSYPRSPILLFRIRYNDYESHTPDSSFLEYINKTTNSLAKLAKQVGYAAAVLQLTRLSNNRFIIYKLLGHEQQTSQIASKVF